jgi:hypothetical protein
MRGGRMRLSTVSRAPEAIGANDAEAPEARILPCTRERNSRAIRHAPRLRHLPRASRTPTRACYSRWSIISFALWMSTR